MQTSHIAAIAVASVLGLDALIHVYWLTGRVWPARDTRALSQAVLNADVPFTPRVLLPLVVILTIGGTAVLARAGLVRTGLPSLGVGRICRRGGCRPAGAWIGGSRVDRGDRRLPRNAVLLAQSHRVHAGLPGLERRGRHRGDASGHGMSAEGPR